MVARLGIYPVVILPKCTFVPEKVMVCATALISKGPYVNVAVVEFVLANVPNAVIIPSSPIPELASLICG